MSGDDREPIGRKGKPAGRKPPRSRPVRSRRDDDDEEIEHEYEDDHETDDDEEEQDHRRESRMTRKAAQRKAAKSDNSGKPRSRKRWWFWLLFKLFIIFAIVMGIYGFYLDTRSAAALTAKSGSYPPPSLAAWSTLSQTCRTTKKRWLTLLEGTQYREVTRITRPGEFTVQANSIDLLRRPFDFPEAKRGRSTHA